MRVDSRLTPTAVVCEKRFDESFIERAVPVNGVVNKITRDKPRLKPDAVSTMFPDASNIVRRYAYEEKDHLHGICVFTMITFGAALIEK
ncbi:hypothetical protein HPB51_012923 [Rhipicephalus microplus]|uniref:Uncharacterized protein n=1 Tax=Rhipicephalus microplus TaxID=6941 RepID=A0A9J6F2G6_RHIMP|nr:hypothetical protein HPB51_012923 [Rhipicephalus microplus]